MNLQAPPTLLKLAVKSLLRDETLAIFALEDLPGELFPPLFKEAFTSRRTNILRSMVTVWPFPCLPLGSLMKTPDLETLKAVLEGLDELLSMAVHPRRCKLQVLELRDVHQNFWKVWAGAEDGDCSPQVTSQKQTVKDQSVSGVKQPLTLVTDLCLKFPYLEEHLAFLLRWARPRKDCLQLCCKKLEVWALPVKTVVEMLKIFEPESMEVLELNAWWRLGTLAWFAPYLGRMGHLRKLILAGVYKTMFDVEEISPKMENCVSKFFSQFPKLSHLQHLSMNGVYFLRGHLKQILSSLKTPLETLWLTQCCLSQADLDYLSQCPVVHQLKHLNLTGVLLFHLCTKPLQNLLETVSATLESLKLEDCRMGNSQFRDLLPALSQCSQLTMVNFFENYMSMPVLKDLLLHTADLNQLTLELYPVPREIYDDMGDVNLELFAQLCPQLMDTLKAIRQPKSVSFATSICLECYERCVYSQETKLCFCWRSEH